MNNCFVSIHLLPEDYNLILSNINKPEYIISKKSNKEKLFDVFVKNFKRNNSSVDNWILGYPTGKRFLWFMYAVYILIFGKSKSIFIIEPLNKRIEKLSFFKIFKEGIFVLIEIILTLFSILWTLFWLKIFKDKSIITTKRNKLKIVYFRTDFFFGEDKVGGSVGHIAGVANGFKNLGHEIFFITSDDLELIDKKKIPIEIIKPWRILSIPEFELLTYNYQFIKKAKTLLKNKKLDLIYQRYSALNFAGVYFRNKLKIPFILEYNGSEVWVARNWGTPLRTEKITLNIENKNLEIADMIVVVSEALKGELVERGFSEEKIVVHPNCIDKSRFELEEIERARLKIRKELNISSEDIVIGFIGTFSIWHGVIFLAKSIPEILKDNKNVKFLLIGDGPLLNEVRQILKDSKVLADLNFTYGNQIILTGKVSQDIAPSYLSACDIFVSPHIQNPDGTKFFGSPTKLFEYMACGKGIVASNLEQIGEILYNSVKFNSEGEIYFSPDKPLAVLTEPGNMKSFCSGLNWLIKRPDIAKDMGIRVRREVLEKYTWEKNVEKVINELYKRLDKKNN